MSLFGTTQALGIDLGSASAKAVVVRIDNKVPRLVAIDALDTGAEGILNEKELYASVAGWLREAPWAQGTQTVGLPQYLATTQISDFPALVQDGLEDMVRYETQQLAGLSDESFVHDFQVLEPGHGRRNPILIGLCRESVVRERILALQGAGLQPASLGMNGIASLNALFFLHPEAGQDGNQPQALVDIGQDTCTIVVFCGSRPLYTGTLDFGSHMLTEALLERAGGDERKAEQRKRELDVNDAASSAVRELMRRLDSEIQNALEHWRDQQPGELAEEACKVIWLCGGGARQAGLPEYLADRYECPVLRFGPPDPSHENAPMPEYAAALGLALLGARVATVGICLMPSETKWALLRHRRLPWLVAAFVLTALAMTALVAAAFVGARRLLSEQDAYAQELSVCDQHIARIRKMEAGVTSNEAQIVPLVEKGNRARQVLRCLDDLAGMNEDGSWFVYLGDELSYESGKLSEKERLRLATDSRKPPQTSMFGDIRTAGEVPDEFPELMSALGVPHVEALILAVYAPFVVTEPYGALTRLKTKLDKLPQYKQVDSLPPVQQLGRDDILPLWDSFLKENPDVRYSSFTLRLELASLPIAIPKPATPEGKKP